MALRAACSGIEIQDHTHTHTYANMRCIYSSLAEGGVAIVEITIKGSMKSPHLPSRSPQPQPKKNLTAFCGVLDSLLELHYAECFFILERCGRRRSRLKFVVDEQNLAMAKTDALAFTGYKTVLLSNLHWLI